MKDSDLSVSREIVLQLLRDEINPVDDAMLFEEDIVLFAVARPDEDDPAWLLRHVADTAWPYERRANVAVMMLRHRTEASAALGEDPR